jgi:hypothetical protein
VVFEKMRATEKLIGEAKAMLENFIMVEAALLPIFHPITCVDVNVCPAHPAKTWLGICFSRSQKVSRGGPGIRSALMGWIDG